MMIECEVQYGQIQNNERISNKTVVGISDAP